MTIVTVDYDDFQEFKQLYEHAVATAQEKFEFKGTKMTTESVAMVIGEIEVQFKEVAAARTRLER